MIDHTLIGPRLTLGEGPLWHPERQRLFWFDIPAGRLLSSDAAGNSLREILFGEPASLAGWIDRDTLLVATASGLQRLDLAAGTWEAVADVEADDPVTRSNDGRVAPDGALWFGTMGRALERDAGTYYRYAAGTLQTLAKPITIPNSTCFSLDGGTAYFSDTARRTIWKWRLEEGAPVGEREVFADLKSVGNPDGAVIDAEGTMWVALYGSSALIRLDGEGREMARVTLPASQPTCPAFGAEDLATLYVTTAADGIADPAQADGCVIALDVGVAGQREHRVRL